MIDYWAGHARKSDSEDVSKTMNQIYTKMNKEPTFREDLGEQIDIGFDLPKPPVVRVLQEKLQKPKSKIALKTVVK